MMLIWFLSACASDLKYTSDLDEDGYTISDGDCDDSRPNVNPQRVEVCFDGVDNDCNGLIDEEGGEGSEPYYLDEDGDGFGSSSDPVMACEPPSESHVFSGGDCNDGDLEVNPDQPEVCNGIDDNCDDQIDDEDVNDFVYSPEDAFYLYDDDDGYVVSDGEPSYSCSDRDRYVRNNDDCDDGNADISPGVPEMCATVGVDDNCDGIADNTDSIDLLTWYIDQDNDGYGDLSQTRESCTEPIEGNSSEAIRFTDNADDCDDGDSSVFPNSHEIELPTTTDIDCDGESACQDLYCDSWIELFLPSYSHASDIAMVEANESLDFWSNSVTWSMSSMETVALSPVVDGYRKLAISTVENDCSGEMNLWEINHDKGIEYDGVLDFHRATSAHFVDLNGDGDLDFIAAIGTHPLHNVLDGICAGEDTGPIIVDDVFGNPMLMAESYGGHKVLTEDLNEDGATDLVVCRGLQANGAEYSSSAVAWGSSSSSANWNTAETLPFTNCGDIISVDMNDDGHLDLVLATANESNADSAIFWGPDFISSTSLDARASAKVVANDFDNDGYMDLIFGQNPIGSDWNRDLPIFWGDSSGNYQNHTTVEAMGCIYPQVVEAGNGDGLDLICPNLKGYTNIQSNDYDVNGMLTDSPPSYIYWGGTGNRYNELSRKSLDAGGALHTLSGDFNENGHPDLLFTPWFTAEFRLYWDNPNDAITDYITGPATRQLGAPVAIGSGF